MNNRQGLLRQFFLSQQNFDSFQKYSSKGRVKQGLTNPWLRVIKSFDPCMRIRIKGGKNNLTLGSNPYAQGKI